MSSFESPHYFFLFPMKNGKKKIGYGTDMQVAYDNLRLRLTEEEMSQIEPTGLKFRQSQMREHIHELG